MTNLNLNIDTGVRLTINDDPARVVSFDPGDVEFAERLYNLIREFEGKQVDYQARADALDAAAELDEHGMPVNTTARIAFMRDVCDFMHDQINVLFGDGTALAVFQDTKNIDAIAQFLEGVMPFVEKERHGRVQKYSKNARTSRTME